MLSEQEIRSALHASRVVPVAVPNPHGPLGLEQLAAAVAEASHLPLAASVPENVQWPLKLPLGVWEKRDVIARAATRNGARRFSASDVAAALIERSVRAG